jgi:hypothetical protein
MFFFFKDLIHYSKALQFISFIIALYIIIRYFFFFKVKKGCFAVIKNSKQTFFYTENFYLPPFYLLEYNDFEYIEILNLIRFRKSLKKVNYQYPTFFYFESEHDFFINEKQYFLTYQFTLKIGDNVENLKEVIREIDYLCVNYINNKLIVNQFEKIHELLINNLEINSTFNKKKSNLYLNEIIVNSIINRKLKTLDYN